jgi:hypothetical protein
LEAQGHRSLSLPKEGDTPSLTFPAFNEAIRLQKNASAMQSYITRLDCAVYTA